MTAFTPARFTPRSTKKVAKVTMKLGTPVFITSTPLRKPIARATTSEVRTDTQTLMCQWDIMIPVIRPVVPVIAPADRSNSPPIISIATTTAMIANDDDSKTQVLAPAGSAKAVVLNAKYKKMSRAATAAPTSGRRRNAASQACSPTRSSRSAGGRCCCSTDGDAVVLMCPPRAVVLPRGWRGPARAGPPRPSGSARAALGELQDVCRVVLGDDGRTRVDRLAAADVVPVEVLQVDPGHAQVALDV